VGFLYDLGILNSKTIAAHCVHLSDDDIQILSETDTKVVFNPESNMKLASGIPKVWEVKKKGITCGIGTDGPASNNNLDLFEEMDTLAKLSKLGAGDPACLSAKDVFRMATIMGAKALGLDNYIGSIEVGKSADIVILDMNSPHLIPSYDPYSTIVYSLRGSDVRDVIVNGKLLVENGKLTMIDWDEIKSKAQVFVEKVKLWTKKVSNM
jgi:5-methylthioadenosine/S-adenosylhomocysteine deaminase